MDIRDVLDGLRDGSLDRAALRDPTLQAVAEFAQWLAFPTELGRYPDDIEVVDARSLYWPPRRETLPLTLLRYRVRDSSGLEPDGLGIGLVGSTTFSLFSYANHERPAEDAYAIHCYWEAQRAGLIQESESVDETAAAAIARTGIALTSAEAVLKVTFTKRPIRRWANVIEFPGKEVLLVAGLYEGEAGWLVCDGPRSIWYPAADLPNKAPARTIAMLHVGRVLLGFETRNVQRRQYKLPSKPLEDAEFLARYERALAAARSEADEARKESFGSFTPIGRHAARYVRVLIAAGRVGDVASFITELSSYWDHNAGYGTLGTFAYDAGLFDEAKRFIEKLRRSYPDHHRSETMALLARIYARQGDRPAGVTLLRDCIARIEADKSCSPSEVTRFAAPLRRALQELEG